MPITPFETPHNYNAPVFNAAGTASSIGPQAVTFFHIKKALVTARKEQYFTQMADVKNMPKHMGKTMKIFEYIPLLDDRNVNSQGIDANGVVIDSTKYYVHFNKTVTTYVVEADASAVVTAIGQVTGVTATKTGASTPWTVTLTGANVSGTTAISNATDKSKADAITALVSSSYSTNSTGNLYGSSKDIGTISNKIPLLGENGGRVNRVGFTRIEREAAITKLGFFTEFTQEQLDFDSDESLFSHISEELVKGAVEISEDLLQKDLLLGAGVVLYAGAAVSKGTISPETGPDSIADYADFQRLSTILDENRTPKSTKVISGSRMVDTRTVSAGRIMFIGSELKSTVEAMKDGNSNPAYIPVHKYADAGNTVMGEVGSVYEFRLVVVPEMLSWAGAGAAVVTNAGHRATGGKYDVFPMLVVGSEAFSTIGFQTDGKTVKFKITTKMPGEATADRTDPYGETGFSSIKWYYGTLVYRPERIAVIMTAARM